MGDVKLADFGVAKALDGLGLEQSVITGKLPYMAPEQARGRAQPSSDLYSLGVVLREMLTGVRPLVRRDLWQRAMQAARCPR